MLNGLRGTLTWVRAHPGYEGSRTLVREAVWAARSRLGKSTIVPFGQGRFYCPAEPRGMARLAYIFRDRYEPELPELHRWVAPGEITVDVGAHYGSYTIALAAIVGDAGRVVAVEPATHALSVLRRNLQLNGLTNVEVVPVGLGDSDGRAVLHMHSDLSRASLNQFEEGDTGSEQVRLARLDDLIPADQRVAFVKIDIEGYELPALRGANRILSKDRPVVLFELQPAAAIRGGLPAFGVWDLLAEHGYRFERLSRSGERMSVADPSTPGAPNVTALPT